MKKNKSIVVALGGNALGNNPEEQLKLVKNTAKSIVDLVSEGYNVVVSHGNGPQVGMINLAFEESKDTPNMPFAECGAMSQGYIGYHLQQAIQTELKARDINKGCASVVTQVLVDKKDPAFNKISNIYAVNISVNIACLYVLSYNRLHNSYKTYVFYRSYYSTIYLLCQYLFLFFLKMIAKCGCLVKMNVDACIYR